MKRATAPRRALWLRLLLLAYPGPFRDEFGSELAAVVSRRLRAATSVWSRGLAVVDTVVETLASAAACHADLLRQDLRYAVRSLLRARGFAATAIAVAALGIGATTAVFSIADHVLLRPLPFSDWRRLVDVWEDQRARGYPRMEPSPANFHDWQTMNRSFEGMGAYATRSLTLTGEGEPQRVDAAQVTGTLLPLLGAPAVLGRGLSPDDDLPGASEVAVLSYAVWQRTFGGREDVLGRTVRLEGQSYRVVGVMPAVFAYPNREIGLWIPLRIAADDLADRNNNYLHVIAKLRPGVTVEAARADLALVAAQLERAHPKENAKVGVAVFGLRETLPRQSRFLLWALVGAAACLLAIACVNLANLLLARAMLRRRELAVRAAIGGGRRRLVRQLVTESALLATLGAVLGVPVGWAALPLLARLVPTSLPVRALPALDARALACAALLTIVTVVAFGVLPALRALRGADAAALREGARAGVGGRRERLRAALVLGEVAATVLLLAGTGLLLRALWRVEAVPAGFDAGGVITLRTPMPLPHYEPTARRAEFYDRVLAEARALPGVTDAAYTSYLPMVFRGGIWPVEIAGRQAASSEARGDGSASLRYVTPGYFRALRIPLRSGRDVGAEDRQDGAPVAVVSQAFAERYWPGETALGRRFTMAFGERTVVGVVGDVRVRGLERESEPQVYLPYRQVADSSIIGFVPKDLAVRTDGDPRALAAALRRIVHAADPDIAVADVRLLQEIVDAETAPRRAQLAVLSGFAALALLLAGIGIHGLLAFTVESRRTEIGVRMALGATPRDILRGVAGQGALLTAGGVLLGLLVAGIVGRALSAVLFGVAAFDAPSYAAAAALALAMTALGGLQPAWRAVRLDPLEAMRE